MTGPFLVRGEIALGADITADPAGWTWTDISTSLSSADGAQIRINRGRRNDSGTVSPASATFELNNRDGQFCELNPGSPYYPDLTVNTPIRLSVSVDDGATWSPRFSGYLSKLPTSWAAPAGVDSWVSVTAESVLRRAGKTPGRSPLRWTAPSLPTAGRCIEYWPMEDDEGATQAASAIPDGVPMTVSGSAELGTSTPPAGSQATLKSDAEPMKSVPPSATGIVRPYTDTGEWTVLGIFQTDEDSAVDMVLLDCDINHGEASTDPDQVRVVLQADRVLLEAYQEDGVSLGSSSTGPLDIKPGDGQWHAFAVRARQFGADIQILLQYEGTSYVLPISNKTLGTVRKVAFPSTFIDTAPAALSVGHLAVYDDYLDTTAVDRYNAAMNAHLTPAGERADARLARIEDEAELIYAIGLTAADAGMYELMGAQADAAPAAVIEDVVETDGGILYEPRDVDDGSLHYRARSSLNAAAVAAPALELTMDDYADIEQEADDHYLTTSVTVTGAGSSATATESPVENETRTSRNLRFPDRLPDAAGWALYQGTRRDYRYPVAYLHLRGRTALAEAWMGTELGDRVLITEPPPGVVDDVDLILEGYAEHIDQYEWDVELWCSPASRYRVAVLDDTTYGRMDTAGSRLTGDVTAAATVLEVETYEGPEWVTSEGLSLSGTAGDYVSTPDTADLDITGDIDLRADVTPASWNNGANQDFVTKWDDVPPGNGSYLLGLSDGRIRMLWSTDGTTSTDRTSTVDVPAADGTRLAVRATIDVDNGAGGHTVTFYTAPTLRGPWTQLGTAVTTAGTTSIYSGTALLEAGTLSEGTVARTDVVIHALEVRSGGTLVAGVDFTAALHGASTLTDDTGLVWTAHGGAAFQPGLGFDVGVGGERMTLIGVRPAFEDTFTRSVASGWGTSDSGHAWSTDGGSASDYSVNGTKGVISLGAVASLRSTYVGDLETASIDRTVTVRVPVLATGGPIQARQAARWDVSANTYYAAVLQVETDQSVTVLLYRVVSGSVTTLATRATGLTHTISTDFRLRMKTQGPWLYAKAWDAAGSEPPQWSVIAYDTAITAAGVWGIRARLDSGNTNTLPVAIQFDDDATANPQALTVTRSVNSVEKTHAAGDAVGLFQPNYLGL